MSEHVTYKKQFYGNIYNKLVNVQKSYHGISKQLLQRVYASIPRNTEEVELLNNLEKQIEVAERNFDKIEEIKFWCNLAFLTEGSLTTETEMSSAILMLEELLEVAQAESTSEDEIIATWAQEKVSVLNEALDGLLNIFDHKVKRKLDIGEVKLQ